MEFVYVVERSRLFERAYPQGLILARQQDRGVANYVRRIHQHGFFVERRKAEEDPSLKQIIPYVVFHSNAGVLLLERTKKQGEQRLHGKLSIGVGGHINPVDDGNQSVLALGMQREVEEELDVDGALDFAVAGCLNDDSTEVGAVHFGLVAVARTPTPAAVRETEMMMGRTLPLMDLKSLHAKDHHRFESWSDYLLRQLDQVLAADLAIHTILSSSATGWGPDPPGPAVCSTMRALKPS